MEISRESQVLTSYTNRSVLIQIVEKLETNSKCPRFHESFLLRFLLMLYTLGWSDLDEQIE